MEHSSANIIVDSVSKNDHEAIIATDSCPKRANPLSMPINTTNINAQRTDQPSTLNQSTMTQPTIDAMNVEGNHTNELIIGDKKRHLTDGSSNMDVNETNLVQPSKNTIAPVSNSSFPYIPFLMVGPGNRTRQGQ